MTWPTSGRPPRLGFGGLGWPLAVAALVLSGCTAGSTAPEPAGAPETTVAATPSAPSPTPDCLTGTFRVVRFAGVGDRSGVSGEGGDVIVTFTSDAFTLTGAGQQPVAVRLDDQAAQLVVDGTIQGTYLRAGVEQAEVAVTTTNGTARISAGILRRTLTMTQLADLLFPGGRGSVTCGDTQVALSSAAVRLDLERG